MFGVTFTQYYSSGTDEAVALSSNGEGFYLKKKTGSFGNPTAVSYWVLKGGSLSNYDFKDTNIWTDEGTNSVNWDNAFAECIAGMNKP